MSRTSKQEAGQKGESLAEGLLLEKGLKLLKRNYRCKLGEVDLIMQDGLVRVFVEVRLRAPTDYGMGYETVAAKKQRKIINTARHYQQKEDYWGDIRFDVVSIERSGGDDWKIEHIEYAFECR